MFNLLLLNTDIVVMCVGYGCWIGQKMMESAPSCQTIPVLQLTQHFRLKLPPTQSSYEEEEPISRISTNIFCSKHLHSVYLGLAVSRVLVCPPLHSILFYMQIIVAIICVNCLDISTIFWAETLRWYVMLRMTRRLVQGWCWCRVGGARGRDNSDYSVLW